MEIIPPVILLLVLIFVIGSILAVWKMTPATQIPIVKAIDFEDLPQFAIEAANRTREAVANLNFSYVGAFDCSMMQGQTSHLIIYINEPHTIEYAVLAVSNGEGNKAAVDEFCSTLLPHGELATNNHSIANPFAEVADHFILQMPGIKDVSQLYSHHLEHLAVLEGSGFSAARVNEASLGERVAGTIRHTHEIQVEKGRSRRLRTV